MLLTTGASADNREPAGAVLDASAGVSTLGEAGKSTRLELFEYLYEQQRIKVPADATLVLSLRANRTDYTIKGPAVLVVRADGLQFESGKASSSKTRPDVVVSALLAGPRTQGAVRLRAPRSGMLPTSGSVVATIMPVISWPALVPSGDYELVLSDSSSGGETRITTNETRWQPSTEAPLAWGHAYRWRVQPVEGAAAGVSGNFAIISATDRDQLASLQPAAGASFAERVVYAKALEHLGVRDDARVLWRDLARERPDNPALQIYLKASP